MTPKGEHVFRVAAIAALVACLAGTGIAIASHAASGWNGAPLLIFCVLAAVEAYISYRAQKGQTVRTTLAHIAIFFVLGQLYVDLLERRAPLSGGGPYLSVHAFVYFVPVFLTWLAVTEVARALEPLERPPAHGFLDESPVRRLAIYFFVAGIFLFVAAGLTQPAIARLFKLPHSFSGSPLIAVFAYFIIGIVALARLQYAVLHHRWQAQHTPVAPGMGGRWTWYVLGFTGAVALLAFILPTSKTLGVLGPGHDAWDQIVLLLRGPLSSLLSLFHTNHITQINRHLKPPPGFHLPPHRPPAKHHGGGKGGSWFAVIQSFVFWVGALVLAGYLVRSYLRHGRRHFRRPRVIRPTGWLGAVARLWFEIGRRLRAIFERIADRLPDAVSLRLATPVLRGRRGRRDGTITGPTRQQIINYYRRMVRQAERRGVKHTPAHAPEEFAGLLSPRIPDVSGDVAALTDAYVEARYSRRQVPPDRVGAIRHNWDRIRQALGKL